MKQMSLEQIAAACGGTYYGAEELRKTEVEGVVTDSRELEPGDLYIALRGERVDGHTFIPDVFASGAAAVVSEEVLMDPAGPYILVSSCPQALKDIAEYYRSTLSIPVIGITGSVGKTSTKEMVAAVLEQKYRVVKTEGNFNNEIGLPLTLLRIRPEHEVAVVEMGISDFGEMHRLAQMARPDICVITNIGPCHLENLNDLEGVLRAKTEIFDFLGPDGVIILNGNDMQLSTIKEKNGMQPIRYFVKEDTAGQQENEVAADGAYLVTADSIVNRGFAGMEAVLHFPDEDCPITEPIPGMHNIYNACAAACVGDVLGMTHAQICAGIAAARTLPGRTNIVETGDIVILDDCYNASPNAMRESLDILAHADGRRIAVLGDMLELGGREHELHREIGAYAASLPIDRLYCTGELARDLADAAAEAAANAPEAAGGAADALTVQDFDSKEALTKALLADIEPGDTILVKASHSMEFSDIVEALKKR